MNALVLGTRKILTMSSLDIAALCEKRHDHVMRDIRKMLAEIGKPAPKFGGSYLGEGGRSHPCFHLPKDLTLTLVTGYNARLRHRIMVRWLELEEAARPAVPESFADALRLAADQAEELATLKPKAAALERIAASPTDLCVRDAGRELGIGQKKVVAGLLDRRWACKDPRGRLRPAHYGLKHGYVRLVARSWTNPKTGETTISDDIRLTRHGVARLAELIEQGKLGDAA